MADPVITDHFRVLAVFERASGLPRDRVVNSWAFRNDAVGGPEVFHDAVLAALDDFYTGPATPSGENVRGFMSSTLAALEYRIYDLGSPPPRVPVIVESLTWTQPSTAELPGEVALCTSFVAGPNLPRNRGRIYVGPLAQTSVDSSGTRPVPQADLVDALAQATERLLDTSEPLTHVVISQADAAAKVITGGFVDNAFDTQRRRGTAADARTSWGSEGV